MLREVPRFHLKLRNGLFDRSPERRPIFNEPPLPGVREDDPDANGVERLESNPPSNEFCFCFRFCECLIGFVLFNRFDKRF